MRIYQGKNPNTQLEVLEWNEVTAEQLLDKMKDRKIAKKIVHIDPQKKEIRLLTVYKK